MLLKLERTEERISRRGGMILLNEFRKRISIDEKIDTSFGPPQSNRGFQASTYVTSLIEMLSDGGSHLEDIKFLEADKAYKLLTERESYPSCDAIGDWLRRHGEEGAKKIGTITNKLIKNLTREKNLILDIDTTMIVSEKGDAKRGYTHERGYNPLMGVCTQSGVFLAPRFQQGNVSPQTDLTTYIDECRRSLHDHITIVRSDSAAYNHDVINYCDGYVKGKKKRERLYYTITADHDKAVMREIENLPATAWKQGYDEQGVEADYMIAETNHTMNATMEAFRLVIKRYQPEQLDLFGDYRYWTVATNIPREEKTAQQIIHHHEDRGGMERMLGEFKIQLQLEHLPCRQFTANSLYFAIGVLTYNCIVFMKKQHFGAEWRRKTIRSLRYLLFHVPVRVVLHAGYVIARIAVVKEIFDVIVSAFTDIRCVKPVPI